MNVSRRAVISLPTATAPLSAAPLSGEGAAEAAPLAGVCYRMGALGR